MLHNQRRGTVRDRTGAFIPGAEVFLRNIETGIELRNSSNAAGEYVAAAPVIENSTAALGTVVESRQSKDLPLNVRLTIADPPVDTLRPPLRFLTMRAFGNRCELVPFDGADHGFFNNPPFRPATSKDICHAVLERSEKFLQSLGF
jgi:hypothetical protein